MSPLPEGVRVRITGDVPWMNGHTGTVLWPETRHDIPGYLVQMPGQAVWFPSEHLEPCDGIGGAS